MQVKEKMEKLLPALIALAEQYEFQQEMTQVVSLHNKFKLRLPLVGAFSAGKSALINALLEDKLLGVAVSPETCLPTEIHYAEQESIALMNDQGVVAELSRQQLKEQDYPINNLDQAHWVDIGLPTPLLAEIKDLVLVDMPGWESGIAEHNQAIDEYVHRSGAYCLVVSAEDGALRQSIKQVLTELKLFNKPVVLIITKCDKRSTDDIPDITQNICKAVTDVLGTAPLQVLTVSARKKRVEGVMEALAMVDQQSDTIYHNMVLIHLFALLERIHNKLEILLNEDNLSLEQVQLACEQIPQELQALKQQLTEVDQQIDAIVPLCIEACKTNLKNSLISQVSSLASAVSNGSNIESEVGSALRQAFLLAIEQDFKPKVTQRLKKLQNLGELAPSAISISSHFKSADIAQDSKVFSQVISFVLTKVLTLVPILKPFAPVIHLLAGIFSSSADREMQAQQQREEAKQYVLSSLIPQVLNQAEPTITSSFNDMAANVKKQLSQESERKAADKQQALQTLLQQLEKTQQADKAQRDKYQTSIDQIKSSKQKITGIAA